jgi:hypothetical protein
MQMIIKNGIQTDLEFGNGDICVNSGWYVDEKNKKVGMVAFSNQSPGEIGAEGNIKISQECKVGDFPIIMTFMRKESIDVVIKALLDAKERMD